MKIKRSLYFKEYCKINKNKISIYGKKWYAQNRMYKLKKSRGRYILFRVLLDLYKESEPCLDCNFYYPATCMDFDHVRGRKIKDVGKMMNCGAEKVQKEIEKCDLVCSNCHRIRTHLEGL